MRYDFNVCEHCWCEGQQVLPTQELRQPERPSILGHRLQFSQHSFPCARDGGYVPWGTEDLVYVVVLVVAALLRR